VQNCLIVYETTAFAGFFNTSLKALLMIWIRRQMNIEVVEMEIRIKEKTEISI